jgi:Rrf2 family protein
MNMASLIRVSDAAAIGLHAVVYLSRASGRVSTRRIAGDIGASEAHLAKVLGRLERAGIVAGTRGPGGGFELARVPENVTLRNVYEAVEGPLKTTRCLFNRRICDGTCMLGDLLADVDRQIATRLSSTRLSDITTKFKPAGGRRRKAV